MSNNPLIANRGGLKGSKTHEDIGFLDEVNFENLSIEEAMERRKAFVGQVPFPWVEEKAGFNPTFMKCDGKIAKYDSKGLAVWRV